MKNTKKMSTQTMVLGAVLTSIVIVLQLIGNFFTILGPFATALPLVPISIGAILCGPEMGLWLGAVFGIIVLCGGANAFLAVDVIGTVITVMSKGSLCGYLSGLVYKTLKRWNENFASVVASIVCPIANTSIFLAGCSIFFLDDVLKLASVFNSTEVGMALFITLATGNFLMELCMSFILSPVVTRLVNYRKKA